MYLDPGFGSMLIQGVIALLAGGVAYMVLARKKIMAKFRKRKKDGTQLSETDIEKE